ncbi:unnamed protein product [Medioppia subpectinata]|uniref:Uncharacterized protein n=1 Tax=Medioppia subpectinata TaxID=1979941 RepID=A0A7R9KRE8_9ACAR|nr:unnamed protein product [Medioppia subpectinata]CAG2108416.1 unnamed protein product [Medioppia subpectinata]
MPPHITPSNSHPFPTPTTSAVSSPQTRIVSGSPRETQHLQTSESSDTDFWRPVNVGEGKTWFFPETLLGQPFPTPAPTFDGQQTPVRQRAESVASDPNFWTEHRGNDGKTWFLPQTLLGQPFPRPAPTLGEQQTRVKEREDNLEIDRDFWTEQRESNGKIWFLPKTLFGLPFPTPTTSAVSSPQTRVKHRIISDGSQETRKQFKTSESTDTQNLGIDEHFWTEQRLGDGKTWFLPNKAHKRQENNLKRVNQLILKTLELMNTFAVLSQILYLSVPKTVCVTIRLGRAGDCVSSVGL